MSLQIKILETIFYKYFSVIDFLFLGIMFAYASIGKNLAVLILLVIWISVYVSQKYIRKMIETYKFISEWKIRK